MSPTAQTTLAHDVSFNGIGLHAANEVHMVLRPAPADTGIVLFGPICRKNRLYKPI